MQLQWCAYCGTRCQERCPVCESTHTVPVAYGYPTPDLFERADDGDVILGGCVVRPDAPSRGCGDCGTAWTTIGDPSFPSLSPESIAGVTDGRRQPTPPEFGDIADQIHEIVAESDAAVLADHAALEALLPVWLQDPGTGEHWYDELPIVATCSPVCRDLLLSETDWAPFSVWQENDHGWTRVAGRGPYLTGRSVVGILTDTTPEIALIEEGIVDIPSGKPSSIRELLTAGTDDFTNWYRADEELLQRADDRGVNRHLLAIDILHQGRWGALMVPVHTDDPADTTEPLVIAVADATDLNGTVAAITEALRTLSVIPPSVSQLRQLVRWSLNRLTDRISSGSLDQRSDDIECLHPMVDTGRCIRCGTEHIPWIYGQRQHASTYRHYGSHQVYRVQTSQYRSTVQTGIRIPPEPNHVELDDLNPIPDVPEGEFDRSGQGILPFSPPFAPAEHPRDDNDERSKSVAADMVYGYSDGICVFLPRTLAESLARSWERVEAAETYADFVGALPGDIVDAVLDAVHDAFEALALDTTELEPYEKAEVGEVPEDFPMAAIGTSFWRSNDLYPLWRTLDHEDYGWKTWSALADALPGEVLEELETGEAIRWESTGEGDFLRSHDPERVARALIEHGSSCEHDQDLIDKAAGPRW